MFNAIWRKGKDHAIPDALSRSPVDHPDQEDEDLEQELATHIRRVVTAATADDPITDEIRSAGHSDPVYQQLITKVTNGFPTSKSRMPQDLLPYWKVQNDLTHDNGIVLYKNRILIISSMRKEVLARLYSAH